MTTKRKLTGWHRASVPEFKVELQPILAGNYDGDTVTFITSDPQAAVEEWLENHYGPLPSFKFKAGFHGQIDQLISKETPELRILIATYEINRISPRAILQFGEPRQWRPAKR